MQTDEKTTKNEIGLVNSQAFGETIKSLRIEAGLSQEQLAARLQTQNFKISRSTVSQIEGGTYSIAPELLASLRSLFGVPYDAFFRNIEIPETGCDYTIIEKS